MLHNAIAMSKSVNSRRVGDLFHSESFVRKGKKCLCDEREKIKCGI